VFSNGCFDQLHRGHVAYLNQTKTLGDVLIVAVNADPSVRRLKALAARSTPSRTGWRCWPPCPASTTWWHSRTTAPSSSSG
jgi:cytidyltransferase-like protein